MNQDIEDPNNHVPKVSPDDDWDDLGGGDDGSLEVSGYPQRTNKSRELGRQIQPDALKDLADPLKPAVGQGTGTGTGSASARGGKSRFQALKSSYLRTFEPSDIGSTASARKQGGANVRSLQPTTKGRAKPVLNDQAQDTTGLGAVGYGKVRRSGNHHVSSARSGNRWGRKSSRGPMAWLLYSGLGVICLTVLAIFLNLTSEQEVVRESEISIFSRLEPMEKSSDVQSDLAAELGPTARLANMKSRAREVYAEFVKAGSVAELLPTVYQAELNEPLLREVWKASDVGAEWFPAEGSDWVLYDSAEGPYAVLYGLAHDYSEFRACFRFEGQDLKLDWRATTGYCSASFDELRKGNGDPNEIRAIIDFSEYYNHSFPEESYQSYRLLSPDRQSTLWVYTERGTPVDDAVSGLLRPSQITGPSKSEYLITVSLLRGPQSSMENQWLIGQLLKPNWMQVTR